MYSGIAFTDVSVLSLEEMSCVIFKIVVEGFMLDGSFVAVVVERVLVEEELVVVALVGVDVLVGVMVVDGDGIEVNAASEFV